MKSDMPYRGISAPMQRRITKSLFDEHPLDGFAAWRDTALELWRGAQFREERYAAIDLTGHRLYREHQTPDALGMYEEMIVSGAWWDYVDALAIHQVGGLLRGHRTRIEPVMRKWSRVADMWKRRTSVLCQVSFKADTDLGLLYACIEPNLEDKEFFIRKAIGWALRSYAWIDPDEVVRYVKEHEGRLSGLSKREALKNVGRDSPKSKR